MSSSWASSPRKAEIKFPVLTMYEYSFAFVQLIDIGVSSPILDFYPLDFELDLSQKKTDWEAVRSSMRKGFSKPWLLSFPPFVPVTTHI